MLSVIESTLGRAHIIQLVEEEHAEQLVGQGKQTLLLEYQPEGQVARHRLR